MQSASEIKLNVGLVPASRYELLQKWLSPTVTRWRVYRGMLFASPSLSRSIYAVPWLIDFAFYFSQLVSSHIYEMIQTMWPTDGPAYYYYYHHHHHLDTVRVWYKRNGYCDVYDWYTPLKWQVLLRMIGFTLSYTRYSSTALSLIYTIYSTPLHTH
jgi:hypothetical protein